MTRLKKFVIICSSVVAGFLIAFFSVLVVFLVRQNNSNEEWKTQSFSAVSSIGEIRVNYSDFSRGILVLNDRDVAVAREKTEDQRRGHFCFEDTDYYIIIVFAKEKPIGFLYLESDKKQICLDKLVFI